MCDNCQLFIEKKFIKKSYSNSSIGYIFLARFYLHFLLLLCQFKDPGFIQTSSQVVIDLSMLTLLKKRNPNLFLNHEYPGKNH